MKNKNQPLISVVMPVHNAEAFLVESVESILHQSCTNFEFIIVDDASTDNSLSILKDFAKKDKRIRLIQNTKKSTISETANKAISLAKGTYLARMDADDIAHEERLSKQLDYLLAHPKTIALGTQCITIDKYGKVTGEKKFPKKFYDVYNYSFRFTPVQQPTLMIASHKLPKDFKYYDDGMNAVEELKLIFRLFQYGRVENLPDYLHMYRIHNKNASFKNPKKEFYLTLKTRFAAMASYEYAVSFEEPFITLFQAILVFALPAFLTMFLYRLIRYGINLPFIKNKARLKVKIKKFIHKSKEKLVSIRTRPLISVVMPVYNAGPYIQEAITSVLDQSYKNFELIVVDDASTDDSYRIIKELAKKDKRVRTYHLYKKVSTSEVVNTAMYKVKGDYIARMDADDIMPVDRLKKQLTHLLANPATIAVGGQCLLIDKKGKIIGEKKFPESFEEIYKYSFRFTPMQQGTLMIASHKLPLETLYYRDGLSDMEEIELIFTLFNHGKVENLPDYLLKYRFHDTNTSLKNPKREFLITVLARFGAIFRYGYKPRFLDILITIIQALIVFCLPKKAVLYLYKRARYKKISQPKITLPRMQYAKTIVSI